MGIIFLLIIVGGLALILNNVMKNNKQPEPCRLHKWIYKEESEQRYMICSVCKLIPNIEED